jgi:hypothetical protein
MRWRYVYPQAPFQYDDLVAENRRRDRRAAEYELLDTGVFEQDRYWDVTVDYAGWTGLVADMIIRLSNARRPA